MKPYSVTCQQCEQICKNQDDLDRHIRWRHEKIPKTYVCDKCNETFTSQKHLRGHVRAQHKKIRKYIPQPCSQCGKFCGTKQFYKWHMLRYHHSRRKCHECGEWYENKKVLMQHLEEQHGILPELPNPEYVCPKCGKNCETQSRLEIHIRNIHVRPTLRQNCPECGKLCQNKMLLENHIRSQHTPFNCPECGKLCVNRPGLMSHVRNRHTKAPGLYTKQECPCPQCGKLCPSLLRLQSHVRAQHEKVRVRQNCPECGKLCLNKTLLESHIRTQHMKTPGLYTKQDCPCPHCGKIFPNRIRLQSHIQARHEKPRSTGKMNCPECGETCHSRQLLDSHLRMQHQREPKCQFCGKMFKTNSELRRHMVTHTKEKPHQCPKCENSFTQMSSLRMHMKAHTNKDYKCEDCDLLFANKRHLYSHQEAAHHGTQLFTVKYAEIDVQNEHSAKHATRNRVLKTKIENQNSDPCPLSAEEDEDEEEPKFQCTQCGQNVSFSKIPTHMDKHVEDEIIQLPGKSANLIFTCKICSKEFSNRPSMIAHLRHNHSGKQYKCDSCEKVCKSMSDLRKHRKIHLGIKIKNFKCDLCPIKFFKEEVLLMHQSVHTGIKGFACELCNMEYVYKTSLLRHLQTAHN